HDGGPTVVGEPILADEHGGIDPHVAVVVERDEIERLAEIHVTAPVEPRLFRILVPGEIEVEIAHGTQDHVVAAVRESIGKVLGTPAGDVVPDVGAPAARGEVGIGNDRLLPAALGLAYRHLLPTPGPDAPLLCLEDLPHPA